MVEVWLIAKLSRKFPCPRDDSQFMELKKFMGKVFLDNTKFEPGSRTILNKFSTEKVVDIVIEDEVDEDEDTPQPLSL